MKTDVELSVLPEWIEIVRGEKRSRLKGPLKGEVIHEGDRNNRVYRYACSLFGRGLSMQEVAPLVHKFNNEECNPPLDAREVDGILESAGKYEGKVNPRIEQQLKKDVADYDNALARQELLSIPFKLVRRTHGKGKNAVFDLHVTYKGESIVIRGLLATELSRYGVIQSNAMEDGVLLPVMKRGDTTWTTTILPALFENHEVEGRLSEEDVVADIETWIPNTYLELASACTSLEALIESPTRSKFVTEDGSIVFQYDALAVAIGRKFRDAKRQHITAACMRLGIVEYRPTIDGKKHTLRRFGRGNKEE